MRGVLHPVHLGGKRDFKLRKRADRIIILTAAGEKQIKYQFGSDAFCFQRK